MTFRQMDRALGVPKGTSFRRFKRERTRLVAGRDYVQLDPVEHAEVIRQLVRDGMAYPVPAAVVLLRPVAIARVAGVTLERLTGG